jgi:hypothetical protein
MLKFILEIRKGILGTIFLFLIFVISFYPLIKTSINNEFFDYLDPLFFIPFLVVPYLKRSSVLIGSFVGSIIYSIVLHLDFIIAFAFSLIMCASFSIYSLFFKSEPDKITHYILNSLLLVITIIEVGWLLSFIRALTGMSTFQESISGYVFFSGILTFIIVSYLSISYGVKLNSSFYILRK